MNKFIAVTSLFVISITMGILTMIYGWGLEPKSWWWIIGFGIFSRLVAEILGSIAKNSKG